MPGTGDPSYRFRQVNAMSARECPLCGLAVEQGAHCSVCGTSLIQVNMRRTVLWTAVFVEYALLVTLAIRHVSLL